MRLAKLWDLIVEATTYLFIHSRPQFYYALMVLYAAVWQIAAAWIVVTLMSLFGIERRLDFELIAVLVGPLAFGGLVAGHVNMLRVSERVRKWFVPTCFGGITMTSIWLLANLHLGDSLTLSEAALPFGIGAVVFMLLAWLMRLDAAAKAKAAAKETEPR